MTILCYKSLEWIRLFKRMCATSLAHRASTPRLSGLEIAAHPAPRTTLDRKKNIKRHFEVSILNFTLSQLISEHNSCSSLEERKSDPEELSKKHKHSEEEKLPPAVSKVSLSRMNTKQNVTKTDDLKDVCYLFAYCLMNSCYQEKLLQKEQEVHAFALEIFRTIYSKTKFSSFKTGFSHNDSYLSDYSGLTRCLKQKIAKLPLKIKNELISFCDPCSDGVMSEFHPLEKLGQDPTFDTRVGNKYTRKTQVKHAYNAFYGKSSTSKNCPRSRFWASQQSSFKRHTAKDNRVYSSDKHILTKMCDDFDDSKNSTVITGKVLKKSSQDYSRKSKQDVPEKIDLSKNAQHLDQIMEEGIDMEESDSVIDQNMKSQRESKSAFLKLLKNPNNQSKLSQSHRQVSDKMDPMSIFEGGNENISDEILEENLKRNPTTLGSLTGCSGHIFPK
ncbi:unnamed protein product [Moneuplotes crassus]|uniref:Uncharacterized protein n=1 Tax=Euplotes crassus TaxID=5936 RepID=A0AAD1XZZ9_EUPCR|nr:unnamed protein product [Moneuplotes crassus]